MTQVVFKVQGGHAIGMGHVIRSLCLADTLRDHGIKVAAFFCNEDLVCLKNIYEKGYPAYPIPTNSDVKSISHNMLNKFDNCSVVIIDQPQPEKILLAEIKKINPEIFIVGLDYSDLEETNIDLIISLYNHHPKLQKPKSEQVIYMEGLSYALIRPEFEPYIKKNKTVQKQVNDILISFGGSDPKGYTLKVIETLNICRKRVQSIHVVIGPNFVDRQTVHQAASSLQSVVNIYDSPRNLAELMFKCDMGFVGAGTMMLEMAAIGTPAVVIPQNDKEIRFGNFLASKNAVHVCSIENTLYPEKMLQSIEKVKNDHCKRNNMSKTSKNIVDGKGRFHITKLINQLHVTWNI